jgi:hypothetical protein
MSRSAKCARAPRQQRILQRPLEMTVGALDRAVLVRDPGIIARWLQLVVPHQALITLRQILLSVGRQITERSRQAVAAMPLRQTTEQYSAFCRPSANATKVSPPSCTI